MHGRIRGLQSLFPGNDVSGHTCIRRLSDFANNEMSTADLAMYALYIGIFISPIQILVELMEMMQKGLSGFRRFLDVMETEPEIQDAPDAVELKDVKGRVCYEDVSFHYSDDETTVLSRIDRDSCWKVSCIGHSIRRWKDNNLFPVASLLRRNWRTRHSIRTGYPLSYIEES